MNFGKYKGYLCRVNPNDKDKVYWDLVSGRGCRYYDEQFLACGFYSFNDSSAF